MGQVVLGGGLLAADQMVQKAIGQVFQVVEPFVQIGVGDLAHAGADVVVHPLHRRLRRQSAGDGLVHAGQPAGILGDHTIGL